MLADRTITELAERLQKAEEEKQFIRMFSIDHPGMTIDDAYAIQRAWTKIKLANGRVIKGHKIGLTSRAMQSAVGIDEPDYGVLFDDMFWNDGCVIPFENISRHALKWNSPSCSTNRSPVPIALSSMCSTPPLT